MRWYIISEDKEHGPFDIDQLRKLFANGRIKQTYFAREEGSQDRTAVDHIKALLSTTEEVVLTQTSQPANPANLPVKSPDGNRAHIRRMIFGFGALLLLIVPICFGISGWFSNEQSGETIRSETVNQQLANLSQKIDDWKSNKLKVRGILSSLNQDKNSLVYKLQQMGASPNDEKSSDPKGAVLLHELKDVLKQSVAFEKKSTDYELAIFKSESRVRTLERRLAAQEVAGTDQELTELVRSMIELNETLDSESNDDVPIELDDLIKRALAEPKVARPDTDLKRTNSVDRTALPNTTIASPGPELEKWLSTVSMLRPELQIEEVRKKLVKLNPGFGGNLVTKVVDGKVSELSFNTDNVSDIFPVRALKHLKDLGLRGSHDPGKDRGFGKLSNISALNGMQLTKLDLCWNVISDLSALSGMPLVKLDIGMSIHIRSLSPLKGMSLNALFCSSTNVSDLSPLKGMPLTILDIRLTQVSDFSILKEFPLNYLDVRGTSISNLSLLSEKRLETLWCGNTNISSIEPLKRMPITLLDLSSTKVQDLTPVKGMQLKTLYLDQAAVTDLTPLSSVKLERLSFSPNRIKSGIDIIRRMQSIKSISDIWSRDETPDRFWKRFPAEQQKSTSSTDPKRSDDLADKAIQNLKSASDSENKRRDNLSNSNSRTFNKHTTTVKALCYSPNGRILATASEDGKLNLWNTSSGTLVATFLEFSTEIRDIIFEPDGMHLWAADKKVAIRLTAQDAVKVKSIPIQSETDSSFHKSAKFLGTSGNGKVYFYDLQKGQLIDQEDGWFHRVALSPTEPIALLGPFNDNPEMPMISLTTRKKIRSIPHANSGCVIQVAYADSGKLFAISHGQTDHKGGFEIAIFDNNGKLIRKLTEPTTWQSAIDFSSDGRFIVAGGGGVKEDWGGSGKDCTIRVWDTKSGKLRSQFKGHSAAVYAIQFSPDGTKIASGGVDKSIRIWDFDPSKSNDTTPDVLGSNNATSPTGQAASSTRESSQTKLPKPVLYLSCDPAVATIPANPNFHYNGGSFVQGKFGQGTRFDGNSHSKLDLKIPTGSQSRTLSVWLKNESNGKAFRHPFSYGSFNAFQQFGLLQAARGTWLLQTMGEDIDPKLRIDDVWHHHAITYDGNQMCYFVDGLPRAKQKIKLQTSVSPIMIGGLGKNPNGNDPGNNFIGVMDELYFFDVALSADQVQRIMQNKAIFH